MFYFKTCLFCSRLASIEEPQSPAAASRRRPTEEEKGTSIGRLETGVPSELRSASKPVGFCSTAQYLTTACKHH